ncbi:MAG: hypothetical protein QNJ98_13745 [Planctomycetota bacterium]|nr:hypothetical protein [Planctomycetota bacterium]
MKRVRRAIAMLMVLGIFTFPMKGCAGGPGAGMGALGKLALSIGASVGTYLLIQELD